MEYSEHGKKLLACWSEDNFLEKGRKNILFLWLGG